MLTAAQTAAQGAADAAAEVQTLRDELEQANANIETLQTDLVRVMGLAMRGGVLQ
jgi:hypothetical protein